MASPERGQRGRSGSEGPADRGRSSVCSAPHTIIKGAARMSLDLFSPDVLRDPYPLFSRLRAGATATFADGLGVWVVSRREEIRAVLADPETFTNALTIAPLMPVCPHAGQILGGLTAEVPIAARDGLAHARARRALMATFPSNPRRAGAHEPAIRAIADDLIDAMLLRGEADLVRDFAWEFAVRVILGIVGVPDEAHERIKRWSDGRFAILWGQTTEAEQLRIARDTAAFWEFCQQLVAVRVREPRQDLVSALIGYRSAGASPLTQREVASLVFDVLSAGHETTSNMLSNGILQLLAGGAWDELVAEPARIADALEEILRYDTPTPGWLRFTARPATVGDVDIPAGQRVLLLLGAANRDETRWPDAERFDIGRADAREHLSFSAGRHFCVGAALARLEGRVALEALCARLPALHLRAGYEPRYVPSVAFRMLESLPVTWGSAV
jgi:cytochrome P450